MFLVRKGLGLGELENELEELVPLTIRDQNLAKLANHISYVFLDHRDWLLLEPSEQKVFGLRLVTGGQLEPQVRDDFTEVHAGDLSDVLVW